MTTILFVGGGTLGHIIPAVAVAREWMKQSPGGSVHFVCSPRGEAVFLGKEHLPHTILDAPRLSSLEVFSRISKIPHTSSLAAAVINL
jgi:UDP-N-acetylglucosamine:LPS N-acetylglucosamine transferase